MIRPSSKTCWNQQNEGNDPLRPSCQVKRLTLDTGKISAELLPKISSVSAAAGAATSAGASAGASGARGATKARLAHANRASRAQRRRRMAESEGGSKSLLNFEND